VKAIHRWMKDRSVVLMAVVGTLTALTIAVSQFALATGETSTQPAAKGTPVPGPTYASDADRRAAETSAMRQTYQQQQQFVRDFATSGRDIHELPGGSGLPGLPTASWGPTLSDAVTHSAGVVIATVTTQSILDGWVDSSLIVNKWLSGGDGAKVVRVRQVGGPLWNNGNPARAELESDPLLWKGKQYVLFLTPCAGTLAADAAANHFYCSSLWGRQFEVLPDGNVRAVTEVEPWTSGFDGRPIALVVSAITAAATP
jgi:hypothetical protein